MLLSYLVTSRARRELLRLLWADELEGSVSELARHARVSFAAAYRELEFMRSEGLAVRKRAGASLVYRADRRHTQSALLERLLAKGKDRHATAAPMHMERVRGWLAAAGAPLLASKAVEGRTPELEEVLAEGLAYSHHDATAARVLPLVVWRHKDRLDYDRLMEEATRRDERQTLGFFLELTGQLSGDHKLTKLSRQLQDRRRTRLRPFFARTQGRMALAVARRSTPSVARRWGYLMNMPLESFASTFSKYAQVA